MHASGQNAVRKMSSVQTDMLMMEHTPVLRTFGLGRNRPDRSSLTRIGAHAADPSASFLPPVQVP